VIVLKLSCGYNMRNAKGNENGPESLTGLLRTDLRVSSDERVDCLSAVFVSTGRQFEISSVRRVKIKQ